MVMLAPAYAENELTENHTWVEFCPNGMPVTVQSEQEEESKFQFSHFNILFTSPVFSKVMSVESNSIPESSKANTGVAIRPCLSFSFALPTQALKTMSFLTFTP